MTDFLYISASFITAFVIAYVIIPSIITISREKKLFDIPNGRSSHKSPTPTTGGIAIFLGAFISFLLWTTLIEYDQVKYILVALIVLFFTGIKDDLIGISAVKKFAIQFIVAAMVVFADIRITSFHGIFGIDEIPIILQYVLSIILIVGITNAYNLIDGIDGLAGGIALIACIFFGSMLYLLGGEEASFFSMLAFALAGGIAAFLRFNFQPAKIFMGDTGSLVVGFLMSILAIKFIEISAVKSMSIYSFAFAPAIAVAVLFVPLFDTARVFTIRILKGSSPFAPDQRHIHHLLIQLGCSHRVASVILYVSTIIMIGLSFVLGSIGSLFCIIGIFVIGFLMVEALSIIQQARAERRKLPSTRRLSRINDVLADPKPNNLNTRTREQAIQKVHS